MHVSISLCVSVFLPMLDLTKQKQFADKYTAILKFVHFKSQLIPWAKWIVRSAKTSWRDGYGGMDGQHDGDARRAFTIKTSTKVHIPVLECGSDESSGVGGIIGEDEGIFSWSWGWTDQMDLSSPVRK